MNLAIHTDLYKNLPIEEALPLIAAAGYKNIELNAMPTWSPHLSFFEEDETRLPRMRALLDQYGITMIAMCLCPDLAVLDDKMRLRYVDYCARAMRFGQALGCKIGSLYFSGNMLLSTAKQKRALKDSLTRLNDVCEETGVDLAVEVHHGNFVNSTLHAINMLGEFNLAHVGYLYCLAHVATYCNEDIFRSLEIAKDSITHIHISDTPLSIENHKHLMPGNGKLDIPGFVHAVKKMGYDKTLTLQLYSEETDLLNCSRETRLIMEKSLSV